MHEDQPTPASVPALDKLAASLAKAQGAIPAPHKNRQVNFIDNKGRRVHYLYADLAGVIDAARKPLAESGLSITHVLDYRARIYGMTTTLMHESGQSLSTWYPLPDPAAVEPKAFGSALTYARRYALSALIGIASEEDDDDGEDAPKAPAKLAGKRIEEMDRGHDYDRRPDADIPVDQGGPAPAQIQPRINPSSPVKPKVTPKAESPATSQPEASAPAEQGPVEGRGMSEAARKRLFAVADDYGWSHDAIKDFIKRWGLESTKQLSSTQYDELLKAIKASMEAKE